MEMLIDHFPVFEANQVLTSGHLNDVFDYLDQQERLTRSHLVGIGIVCGLEIKLTGGTIALSKGCGVTSEGYLIVEPDDLSLVAYRGYTLPPDIDYPQFKNGADQYALWELFEAGTPNTTLLNSPANFLNDKAVLLFLELKKEGLRNCSPNNCDDKGSQVTATVRRLLIAKSDLDKIIAAANTLGGGLTASDIDAALSARLNLPDLRLRRFDVTNSNPATSNDVYTAFLNMIRTGGLAHATSNALAAAYTAFKPLLAANYASNPFAGFTATYGFLDSAPGDVTQVTFLQYYADLFDDLLRAYDEFRWKGLELICACCPDDGLFPRHLMLGLLHPEAVSKPAGYRQGFLPSPAIGDCAKETKGVVQLFARLVEMAARFTNTPALPKANPSLPIDPQIRATPSTMGCGCDELAGKAIPFYYAQNGNPALYRLWSPIKTLRDRANQNLGYNSDLYANPAAPAFVTDPLRYDVGPYNFLRIEGHLGKAYQDILRSLLTMKSQYRLPIDVIALRTGVYDDSQPVDLSKETARFQDLEAIYEALRGDLMAALTEGAMQLYDLAITPIKALNLGAGTPKLTLLEQYAPHYGYSANTIGSWYEHYLTRFETQGYIDIDQNAFNGTTLPLVYCTLFTGTQVPEAGAYPNVVAIYYISKLSEILPPTLDKLDYADFENKYQDLMALIRYLRSDAVTQVTPDLKNFLPEEEFIDFCEGILFSCKLDAIKAVNDDFVARVGDLKKRQFLSYFLQQHPGIQHKAGVPMGGTFILVYHGEPPPPSSGTLDLNFGILSERFALASGSQFVEGAMVNRTSQEVAPVSETQKLTGMAMTADMVQTGGEDALVRAIGNISSNRALIENEDVSTLIGMLTGRVSVGGASQGAVPTDPAAQIISTTVGGLSNGTVIADFYLPYQISCDCPGIQYVLPKSPPTFTLTAGCTAANGLAAVAVDAKGGIAPYDVAIDGGAYAALDGPLQLAAGTHSIVLRDADGTESAAQSIVIPDPLKVGDAKYACDNGQYTATAPVTGGTPHYKVDGQDIGTGPVVVGPVASGTDVSVSVTDAKGCTTTAKFTHTCCTLPCDGIALNRGYRFFLPDADKANAYKTFTVNAVTFKVTASLPRSQAPQGIVIDLSRKVADILKATAKQLPANFTATVNGWINKINDLIKTTPELAQPGKTQWLTLAYRPVGPGRLGVLSIEHFKCLSFDIEINLTYATANGQNKTLDVHYTPADTTIKSGDVTSTVPVFDGTTTDKCSDAPAPVPLCPTKPDYTVSVQIRPGGEPSAFVTHAFNFMATASVPVSGLTFFWEASGGSPETGNGQDFATQFATAGTKVVTVTAFNVKGCSATASMSVQVGARG